MNAATLESRYATVATAGAVRIERVLPGPLERVWAYLTDAELRRKWLAAGDMQPAPGTSFEMVWRNDELTDPPGARPDGFAEEHRMRSAITAFEPLRRLSFTWGDGDVTFDLAPQGDEVLLVVTHRGISNRENMLMIGAGWHIHLDLLDARISGAATEPFWDGWRRLREEYDRRMPA